MSAEKMTENSQLSLAEPRKNRRMRRKRELQDSAAPDITPTTRSVPSTTRSRHEHSHKQSIEATISSNIATNGSMTFEEGEDFIPFVISDRSDDDEPGPSRRRTDRTNERQREAEKISDRDAIAGHQLSGRQAMSNGDLNEVPTSDCVKEKSNIPGLERERDRQGKEAVADDRYDRKNGHRRDRKRKYEEYDDGYSNQKQRAEVGSRKCPWVAGLDLSRCSNVAEMWVEWCSSFELL
jgi:non-canonical poly(A) RNA polymerase PAPD5/7